MKPLLYSEFELPRASVQRIIKNSCDGKLVQKDAKLACTKAATVFVSYLTAAAQEFAATANQKTLSATHILQAVEAIGFGPEFGPILSEALENIKRQALQAKEAKNYSNSHSATTPQTSASPQVSNTTAGLLEIDEEDAIEEEEEEDFGAHEDEEEDNTQLN